jgi:hypothetical protein
VRQQDRPRAAGGRPQAGLEFVEKLLTSAMVALLDGTEREHATPASRTVASLVELAKRMAGGSACNRRWRTEQ